MDSQLLDSIDSWADWIKQFQYDPTYGYLIDPHYKPICFDYQTLNSILTNLHNLNESQQIIQVIQHFPEISFNIQLINYQDMIILHDQCSYLIHSYIKILRDKKIDESDIKIPKNLSTLAVQSSSYLKIKIGMSTGIGYNWYFTSQVTDLDNIKIQDIEIKYYYTQNKKSQGIFFKVSVITSYLLGRIIKDCFQINCIIMQQPNLVDQVFKRFRHIKFCLKRIFQVNLQIQKVMDPQFFFYKLRIYVAGFLDVYFQGIQQRISSSGGAGGYDPSFQAFQRAFSLSFQDQIGHIQQKLRHGIPQQNRNLIDFFTQHSIIQQYCQCTKQLQDAYNEILQEYAKYLQLHGTFIRNYILNMIPNNHNMVHKYGEHGQGIQRIMEKFKFVRLQEINQNNIKQYIE